MLNRAIIQQSEQGKDFAVTVEESLKHPSVQHIYAIKKEANEILCFYMFCCEIRIKTREITGCSV